MNTNLPTPRSLALQLPPILAGTVTPDVKRRVEAFYFSIASIFGKLSAAAPVPAYPARLPRRRPVVQRCQPVSLGLRQ